MIESILLAAARVFTFDQTRQLTNASGFFFERDERLFLVTSRHVLVDAPTAHFPDRIEIEEEKLPSTTGAPGAISCTNAMPESASARVCAAVPATVTGDIAPARMNGVMIVA